MTPNVLALPSTIDYRLGLDGVRALGFENWLLENYGFEADMTPIKFIPPRFVRRDGYFDVYAYERWKANRLKEYQQSANAVKAQPVETVKRSTNA